MPQTVKLIPIENFIDLEYVDRHDRHNENVKRRLVPAWMLKI